MNCELLHQPGVSQELTSEGSRRQATHAAAVEAILASAHADVLKGDALTTLTSRILALIAAKRSPSTAVWRSSYTALTQLSKYWETKSERSAFGPAGLQPLKALLFDSDLGIEALRLLRADAIVAVAKVSAGLTTEMRDGVSILLADEKSKAVRDRLLAARP